MMSGFHSWMMMIWMMVHVMIELSMNLRKDLLLVSRRLVRLWRLGRRGAGVSCGNVSIPSLCSWWKKVTRTKIGRWLFQFQRWVVMTRRRRWCGVVDASNVLLVEMEASAFFCFALSLTTVVSECWTCCINTQRLHPHSQQSYITVMMMMDPVSSMYKIYCALIEELSSSRLFQTGRSFFSVGGFLQVRIQLHFKLAQLLGKSLVWLDEFSGLLRQSVRFAQC